MRASPLLAAGTAAAALAAAGATAQEGCPVSDTTSALPQVEGEYRAARDSHQETLRRWSELDAEWDELRNESERLRGDNEPALYRVLAQLQAMAASRDTIQSAHRALEEDWLAKGRVLVYRIDAHLQMLNQDIEQTPAADLISEYECWDRRRLAVESATFSFSVPELRALPEVREQDGDSPEDLRRKARRLELGADVADRFVQSREEDIEALRLRERRDRSHRDAIGRARDAMNVPMGPGTDESGAADTLPVLTIQQRIQLLEGVRDEAAARRDELREKAREMCEKAGGCDQEGGAE